MPLEVALRSAVAGAFLLVLLACAENDKRDQPARRAIAPAPSSLAAPPARDEPANLLRARVSKLPAFAALPGSDQAWVLAQAGARIMDKNAPELVPLVEQLAEVRQFAVSEREEPLPAASLDIPQVR
jgi:hypothetical protein